jgi:hypothetical protein
MTKNFTKALLCFLLLIGASSSDAWFGSAGAGGGKEKAAAGGSSPVVESDTDAMYETDAADQLLTITKPTGTVSGNLLVAVVFTDDDATGGWTPPGGWTEGIAPFNNTDISCALYWKTAGGSEPASYDFTVGDVDSSVMGGGMVRISGANATPIDVSNTATGLSTSIDTPSVTTTVTNTLILRFFGADDNDYTSTPGGPASHTVLWENVTSLGGDMSSGGAHKDQAAAEASGTGSFTGLGALSEEWCAITIAIKSP